MVYNMINKTDLEKRIIQLEAQIEAKKEIIDLLKELVLKASQAQPAPGFNPWTTPMIGGQVIGTTQTTDKLYTTTYTNSNDCVGISLTNQVPLRVNFTSNVKYWDDEQNKLVSTTI